MTLEISMCGYGWTLAVSDTLPSALSVACENIPILTYAVNQVGKFVKFTAVTFYGHGAALNYIFVDYGILDESNKPDYVCPSKKYIHNQGI